MAKKQNVRKNVSRTVAFEDLSLEQAKELLALVETDNGVFGQVGRTIFDQEIPRWSVNISMTERVSPAGRVINPTD